MHYSNMLHLMIHIAVDGVSNPYAMCVWKCFSLPSAAKKVQYHFGIRYGKISALPHCAYITWIRKTMA